MRTDRLIIFSLLLLLLSCKTIQTTQVVSTVSSYSEDLSVLRPELKESQTEGAAVQQCFIPAGHIMKALDSVSNVVVRKDAKSQSEQGYTIQVYNGSSREDATKKLGKIRIKFPDLKAEMIYFQPDFRVKAGQFIDRLMAYEAFEKVRLEFGGALLIPEKINFKNE